MNRFALFLLLQLLACVYAVNVYAQNAAERTAPFTAVKWLENNPYVLIDEEWHLLVAVEKTEVRQIINFCKEQNPRNWKKYFSEDLVEAMQKMNKPLPVTVELLVIKDGKIITRKENMTKEKRRAVWTYNNENKPAEQAGTQKDIIEQVQKDIAGFANTTLEKPFTCKSAKIEFVYTGHKLYAGKETLYIDDYGKTVISILDKPGIMNQREHTTTIWKDNKSTVINHVKKTYFTSPVRPKCTEPPVISYSTETQRKQGGYSKKGNEKVAGKDCTVYEHGKMKVTYWLWQNVDVKLVNYSLGGNTGYTKEATSISENITIPALLLEIPPGYKKQ